MKGLALARRYYEEIVGPAFEKEAPSLVGSMAFGLFGAGSECYGFDDEISRDHDWGPRVGIWIPDELYDRENLALRRLYESLPQRFLGFGPVKRFDVAVYRDGPIPIDRFFRSFLGSSEPPTSPRDWMVVPEWALSTCTNGEVFSDPLGRVTAFRDAISTYFPSDVWKKKIASRLKMAGQHGQYNFLRAEKRGDRAGAVVHIGSFLREGAALIHLLARQYRPFDKWLFRSVHDLGPLGEEAAQILNSIASAHPSSSVTPDIERFASLVVDRLESIGLVRRNGLFLVDYAAHVERLIEDPQIRSGIGMVE